MIRLLVVLVLTVAIMLGTSLALHRRTPRAGSVTAEAEPPKPVVAAPPPRFEYYSVDGPVYLVRETTSRREWLVNYNGGIIAIGVKP